MSRSSHSSRVAPTLPVPAAGDNRGWGCDEFRHVRPIAEWQGQVRERRAAEAGVKHIALVDWLKTEHGMGHGHANALVKHTLDQDAAGRARAGAGAPVRWVSSG